MTRPYRPHDVYSVTCECGRELESVTHEVVCICGLVVVMEWGFRGASK